MRVLITSLLVGVTATTTACGIVQFQKLDPTEYKAGYLSGFAVKQLSDYSAKSETERAKVCASEQDKWFSDPNLKHATSNEKSSFMTGCKDALRGDKPVYDPGVPYDSDTKGPA